MNRICGDIRRQYFRMIQRDGVEAHNQRLNVSPCASSCAGSVAKEDDDGESHEV